MVHKLQIPDGEQPIVFGSSMPMFDYQSTLGGLLPLQITHNRTGLQQFLQKNYQRWFAWM
jgi:hypothetical protein